MKLKLSKCHEEKIQHPDVVEFNIDWKTDNANGYMNVTLKKDPKHKYGFIKDDAEIDLYHLKDDEKYYKTKSIREKDFCLALFFQTFSLKDLMEFHAKYNIERLDERIEALNETLEECAEKRREFQKVLGI